MCISDRSLHFSVGSISDLCISVCKWCPGYRENRSAEVPAGNKVEAVKRYFWNPSNDRSKYLCNCRCHSPGCADCTLYFCFYGTLLPEENLQTIRAIINRQTMDCSKTKKTACLTDRSTRPSGQAVRIFIGEASLTYSCPAAP